MVKIGTGKRARRSPASWSAGKTGTTENYGDAWFVGLTPEYTVAVWVGYPNKFKPMKTEFHGQPVAGGTFPAAIWRTFMESVLQIDPPPELKKTPSKPDALPGATVAPGAAATAAPARRAGTATARRRTTQSGGDRAAKPQNPAPRAADERPRRPAPAPTARPAGAADGDGAVRRRPARRRRRRHRRRRRRRRVAARRRAAWPRAADEAAARRRQKRHGQLGRLGDADARAGDDLGALPLGGGGSMRDRAGERGRCR